MKITRENDRELGSEVPTLCLSFLKLIGFFFGLFQESLGYLRGLKEQKQMKKNLDKDIEKGIG